MNDPNVKNEYEEKWAVKNGSDVIGNRIVYFQTQHFFASRVNVL